MLHDTGPSNAETWRVRSGSCVWFSCEGGNVYALQTLSLEASPSDDFLDALLGESDSSAAASPLWSPCTTDSGINDDPPTDPKESLQLPSCTAFPAFIPQSSHPPSPLECQPQPSEATPYVSIDLGKSWFAVLHQWGCFPHPFSLSRVPTSYVTWY